jgi:26S proteasome regulatory subunit N2
MMETDESTPLAPAKVEEDSSSSESAETKVITKIHSILSGELSIKLYLEFLSRNNKSDPQILKKTKTHLESKTAVYHSAITVANAYSNAGTTSDTFLRQNLEWLAKATNWTKFTATAGLGVIHKVYTGTRNDGCKPLTLTPSMLGSNRHQYGSLGTLLAP